MQQPPPFPERPPAATGDEEDVGQQQQRRQNANHQSGLQQQQQEQQDVQVQTPQSQNRQQKKSVSEEEQVLALKVMRLYKPRAPEPTLGLGIHMLDLRSWICGNSGVLLLPGSFGKIYIGQVFACYVSVCHSGPSDQVVRNVAIRADLEVEKERTTILDRRESSRKPEDPPFGTKAEVQSGDMIDLVIEKELLGMGMHTLRVNVEFDSAVAPGTRRAIRKHYKFEVDKPLSFWCKFHKIPAQPADDALGARKLLAQVTIKNLTGGDLLVPELEMVPDSSNWKATRLCNDETKSANFAWEKLPTVLASNAVQDFLFIVEVDESMTSRMMPGDRIARIVTRWRTEFSEQGRLMSQPLIWKQAPLSGVHVSVLQPEQPLQVGVLSSLSFTVTNALEEPLPARLRILEDAERNFVVSGPTEFSIGSVPSKGSNHGKIDVMPLRSGLHKFARLLQIYDEESGALLNTVTEGEGDENLASQAIFVE